MRDGVEHWPQRIVPAMGAGLDAAIIATMANIVTWRSNLGDGECGSAWFRRSREFRLMAV